jgi:tetratricopeptide (TPR) repeat protein
VRSNHLNKEEIILENRFSEKVNMKSKINFFQKSWFYRRAFDLVAISYIFILFLFAIVLSLLFYIILNQYTLYRLIVIGVIIVAFIYFSNKIWKRRSYLIKVKTQTLEEQADRYIYDLFTNQEFALMVFDEMINSRGFSRQRLISIYGLGGTGKSWLLRVYRYKAQSRGILVSLVDGSSAKSVIEVLNTISHDLERKGINLLFFNKIMDQYKRIQSRVSSESRERKPTTKLAVEIGKQIPVLSQTAQIFDIVSQEEFLVFLRSFLSKEDIDLYVNPERVLTDNLIKDIEQVILQHRIVLLFDTYEQMSLLDKWLKSFVAQLSGDVLVVIAGQIPLSDNWNDLRAITKMIPIELLSKADAKTCIENFAEGYLQKSIPESEKEMILEFSEGLPLAISWSVDLMSRYKVDTFSDIKNEVIGNLIDTMTRVATSDMKKIIEICSIPRWFNEDMLHYLIDDENVVIDYITLRSLPFVRTRPEGLALHDRVREYIIQELKTRTFNHYIEVNGKCINFYKKRIDTLFPHSGKENIEYQKLMVELVYHTFCVDLDVGFDLLRQEINFALELSKLDYCNRLLAEASLHQISIEQMVWLRYWEGELAYRKGEWYIGLNLLENLYKDIKKNHLACINVCLTLGRIYYQQGELIKSRDMFNNSLEFMKKLGDSKLEGYITEQLAKVYRMEGDIDRALILHENAIKYTEESRDDYQICSAPGSYGTTLLLAGRLREGIDNLSRSIESSRRSGYLLFVCTGLRSKAVGLMHLGRLKEAEHSGFESYQIAERLGDIYNKGFARLVLGQVYTEQGSDSDLAKSMLEASISDLKSVGALFDLGNAWVSLGNYYRTLGDIQGAMEAFSKAKDLLAPLKFKYGMGWLHYYIGLTLFADNNLVEAKESILDAEEIARSISSLYLKSRALLYLAIIALSQNLISEALKYLESAKTIAESRQYYDVLAMISLNKGKTEVETITDEISSSFWESLTSAVKYNSYLFDKIANEINTIYKDKGYETDELSHIMHKYIDQWHEKQNDGSSWIDVEMEVRFRETNQRYSYLESILLS